MLVRIVIFVLVLVLVGVIYYKIKQKQIAAKEQKELEEKRKKQELIRINFRKVFPEVDEKFSNLLRIIGKDEKMSFYRTEASKAFNELLRVFLNIVESDKRLDNLDKLRRGLLPSIKDTNNNDKISKESIEKSKILVERINKESNELKKYIANAKDEIKATGLDFVKAAAEIELAKASGQSVELSKLRERSKNLEFITTHLPISIN